ncbi:MAG: non-ribosomal peptide synthetase, partial [Deltaproteobacteria bacterium]
MRKNIEAIYPLSPMQQGMLFHTLLTPESEVYFEQFHCILSGSLSIERFEEAWQRVTDRHPALRTAFVWENLKEPLQVVGRRVKIRIERHDWRKKGEEAARQDFHRFLAEDRKKGFALNKAPLMRLTLFQLDEGRYRFLWSYHHLLLDGWCLSLILKEVLAFYMAAVQGKSFDLPPPRPYQDYIAWLKKQDLGAAEAFWRKHLRGFAAPTPLGIDRTPEGSQTRNLDSHEIEHALSETTTARVDAFCRAQRITTNNLVRGLWALLLARYAGEDDVLFGATVSGRPAELPGVESIVGLFINTLPVRVRIAWEASFGSFLTRLQGEELEAHHFEYSPLVEIQGWSEVPRGTPLFESLLVFENYPLDAGLLDLGEGVGISDLHFVERTNLPLTLFVVPGKRLTFRALYHTARFDAAAIERMLGHLETLLERALANPETPLARLSPLTEGERHQLLEVWNDTAIPDFVPETIHGTFERQAAATPERVAARSANGQITFGALDRQANRIAHALRRRGVAPEVPVALLAGRSLETLAAILGILKAGGAYLPLDPGYPKERLAFMLRDSGARFVVTTRAAWEPFEDFQSEIEPLFLDEAEKHLLREPETPLDLPISPHHPAYIVYTSGSTGRPKGVIGLHAGAVNRFEWMWRTYPFAEGEVGCQKT